MSYPWRIRRFWPKEKTINSLSARAHDTCARRRHADAQTYTVHTMPKHELRQNQELPLASPPPKPALRDSGCDTSKRWAGSHGRGQRGEASPHSGCEMSRRGRRGTTQGFFITDFMSISLAHDLTGSGYSGRRPGLPAICFQVKWELCSNQLIFSNKRPIGKRRYGTWYSLIDSPSLGLSKTGHSKWMQDFVKHVAS